LALCFGLIFGSYPGCPLSSPPWSAICTWEDGVREDDAREGAEASRRWREGEEKAGGGGTDGRKRSMRERCAPGFDLGF
jgi:hypothetical protein